MILRFLDKYRDIGLLILRLGLGAMFITHGSMKLFSGSKVWADIGAMGMGAVGITSFPVFWGFMAACAEFFGGIAFAAGFFFRPACLFLVINMTMASLYHLTNHQGFQPASHAIEDGIVFLGFILIGPGKYSLDELIRFKKE
ncbi:MAG: DoxX family protein [Planctomycetes bacterium]|nr:DoxX family protein [Planctomycetota bacterium]